MRLLGSTAKTNWVFLGIIALVALITGAGIFALQNTTPPSGQQPPEEQQQEKEETNTSTWQTYRTEEYGFEVKYPSDWSVQSSASASVVEILSDQTGSRFSIVRNNNPRNLSLDGWFREATVVWGRPTVKAAAERIAIKGIPAYRIESELSPPNPLFEIVAIADSHRNIFTIHARYEVATDRQILEQILSTFRFVEDGESLSSTSCVNEPEGEPVITSISPKSGPVGTVVEIRGCNLSGFEGDLDAVFVRSDDAEIPLYGGIWHSGYGYTKEERGKLIRVIVRSYCESGSIFGRYSGIEEACETVEATPGVYRVHVTAWTKRSNGVNFTITK